ncbi:MAG: hypothetical protein H0U23_13915 [Blastocatellia bacterium]|nr:hypothetical protein [Blastocatellia bacterium]
MSPTEDAARNWGGARLGAGRPARQWPSHLIRIAATAEEKSAILSGTTPRERTEALLKLAQRKASEQMETHQ